MPSNWFAHRRLRRVFRSDLAWKIPQGFNIGHAVSDAWAEREPERICLEHFSPDGKTDAGRKCLGNAPGDFRIQSPTSNLLNLVWFLDLKFLNANAIQILGTSNPPH